MSDAWGGAWGTAWSDAWGSAPAPPAPANFNVRDGIGDFDVEEGTGVDFETK